MNASPIPPGLSSHAAAERRAGGLGNTTPLQTSRTYWQILSENLFTFVNFVLFGLGLALVLLRQSGDAFISVGVILTNVLASVVQEIRAKRKLDQIALITRPTASVLRDGQEQLLDPNEVVMGDVLVLKPGDQVVADGPLLAAGLVEMDESLLTGESDPVQKHPGDPLFSGSFCLSGGGYYQAEQVGAASLVNRLASSARSFRRQLTPLQQQTNLVTRVLLLIATYLEVLLLVRAVIVRITLIENVRRAVVVAGLIPNGLFLAIAVAYALAALRMAGRGALVQAANAVESLNSVDVLCMDKTGTLTSNRLSFEALELIQAAGETGLPSVPAPAGPPDLAERQPAEAGALIRDGCPAGETEIRRLLGDFAATQSTPNNTIEAIAAAFPGQRRVTASEAPFSSQWRWSGLVLDGGGQHGTLVLGAPEALAAQAAPGRGFALPEASLQNWTRQGLRVLLLAWSPACEPFQVRDNQPLLPPDLQPLALLALRDELRPGLQTTLRGFVQAGVALKVISGDHPETVAALARQAGLGDDLQAISGFELAHMSRDELRLAAERGVVFGRISPQQKETLVEVLRQNGHYVAMTGDGVNDVLSLKKANLAIAMQSGSPAARSVADIVLLKDSFESLPYAVREGQRIQHGVQQVFKLFMVRILTVALLVIATGVIGFFPFTPRLSSLLSLLTVGLPSLALVAWAKPAPGRRHGAMGPVLHFVVPATVTLSLMALLVYTAYLGPEISASLGLAISPGAARTALTLFTTLCGLVLIVFVQPPSPFWVGGDHLSADWRPTWLALGLCGLLALLAIFHTLGRAFDLTPLGLPDYIFLASLAAAWALALRFLWRRRWFERFLGLDLWP